MRLRVVVEEHAAQTEAGIVDQHVDLGRRCSQGLHEVAGGVGLRQIGSDRGGGDAVRRLELAAELAQLPLAARHEHQIVAVTGEQSGQLQPNATQGTGDKCCGLHPLLLFSEPCTPGVAHGQVGAEPLS